MTLFCKTRDRRPFKVLLCLVALTLSACSAEKRDVGPAPPLTPPTGSADNRQKLYQESRFEQGEGGRFFRWAGCDQCHTDSSPGAANLADDVWKYGGSIPGIYKSISEGAPGMPAYAERLTPQQIWQIAGYVKGLPKIKPNMRRRNGAAQAGEPSGATWRGALR